MTIVMSSPLAGAEMMTFLAPAARCLPALSASVKKPVDSMTMSAPTLAHGRAAGSRSAKTGTALPSMTISPSPAVTSLPRRPRMLSYFSRCARVLVSVRSLMPTISTSAPLVTTAR
jgi:hypothetical protein